MSLAASRLPLFLAGFPNPVSWAVDKARDFLGGIAESGFEMVLAGLTAWVLDAVVWVVGSVFEFFLAAADPNVQADWFVTGDGPYATTAAIGATLLVGFVLAGVAQGVLSGDTAGMLRRIALDLPLAVVGMVGLVTVTQALVRLTDALSRGVLGVFGDDVEAFTEAVTSVGRLSGGIATAFVVFLLGIVAVLAGIVLVAELVIRAALVYVVVALAPLVFAAQMWPALRGMSRKLLDLLFALVVSKLVVAVALAVAAAAAAGTGSGGEVTALPPPEVITEDPGGSVAQGVGLLLAAAAAFGVAAFSPLLVVKLLPVTEAALAAQGIRGGPLRAGQQAITLGYYTRYMRGGGTARRSQLAAGGVGGSAPGANGASGTPAATGPGGGAGGAGAGAAASGAVAAVGLATRAASSGARAMTDAAASVSGDRSRSSRGTPPRTTSPGSGATPRRSAPRPEERGDGDGQGPGGGRRGGGS